MIKKDDILKMVKAVTKQAEGKSDRRLLNPKREWAIGLILAVLLLVAASAYSLNRFSYFLKLEETLPASSLEVIDYQHGTMREVLDRFDSRHQEFQNLRGNVVPISSPTTSINDEANEAPPDGELPGLIE